MNARPRARRRALATHAFLPLLIAAGVVTCGGPEPTTREGAVHEVVLETGDGRALPVALLDRTGIVLTMLGPEPDGGEGVRNGADQMVLIYSWTGGACDTRTLLTFDRTGDGFRLLTRTEMSGDACILIGVGRQIELQLIEPVDAATVLVQQGQ